MFCPTNPAISTTAATKCTTAATIWNTISSPPTEAVNTLMKAIDIFTDMGRFTVAAKHHQTIAEIYETDKVDLEKCIKHYEKAADFFRGEESTSAANKCQLKVAQYAAEMKDYEKAISIYDQVCGARIGVFGALHFSGHVFWQVFHLALATAQYPLRDIGLIHHHG